jgi:hypothetical protein
LGEIDSGVTWLFSGLPSTWTDYKDKPENLAHGVA